MSREIKFRALKKEPKAYVHGWNGADQTKNTWVYGSAVIPIYINTYPTDRIEMVIDVNYDELDYWQPSYSVCDVIPDTVGQYTGVKDKNGKEVYEGDIVKVEYTDGQENYFETVEVSWDKEDTGFSPWNWQYQCDGCDLYCEIQSVEVIGNVYENADLLKEGRK